MEGQKAAGRTHVLQVFLGMSSQRWMSTVDVLVFWQHWWWDGAGAVHRVPLPSHHTFRVSLKMG